MVHSCCSGVYHELMRVVLAECLGKDCAGLEKAVQTILGAAPCHGLIIRGKGWGKDEDAFDSSKRCATLHHRQAEIELNYFSHRN